MTRYDILFGQNYMDLSFAGLGGTAAQLKCDIELGDVPENYTLLDTLVSEHDGTTYMLYDLQDIMPVGDALPLPVFTNGYALYDDFVKVLSLKYYNDTKNSTVTRKILPSGGVEGYDWTASFGQFLTKQPAVQKTNFRATEWLWYLMNYNESINDLVLKIAITTKGKQTITKSVNIEGYMTNRLVCVDVSAEMVASMIEVDKKYMAAYKVWLENDGTRLSEYREYELSNSSAYDVELIVLNSFGVWDTINVVAAQKTAKEFDTQYSESRRKLKLNGSTWVNKYSLSIADLEQGWLGYLAEIIVSRKTYLRDGSELVPIVCTTKNYDDFYNSKVADEATLEFRSEATHKTIKL